MDESRDLHRSSRQAGQPGSGTRQPQVVFDGRSIRPSEDTQSIKADIDRICNRLQTIEQVLANDSKHHNHSDLDQTGGGMDASRHSRQPANPFGKNYSSDRGVHYFDINDRWVDNGGINHNLSREFPMYLGRSPPFHAITADVCWNCRDLRAFNARLSEALQSLTSDYNKAGSYILDLEDRVRRVSEKSNENVQKVVEISREKEAAAAMLVSTN
eukprot:501668-Hanusia_phi.AAC.1